MATKKKGTGFAAPAIGTAVPKGYVRKVDKNGRVSYVPPKKKSKKK